MSTPDAEANVSQYNRYQTQKINSYLKSSQMFFANRLDQQTFGFFFVVFWFYFLSGQKFADSNVKCFAYRFKESNVRE